VLNLNMWYTRRGDDGTSKTLTSNECISKASIVFDVLGSLDEMNAWLGFTRASLPHNQKNIAKQIIDVQEDLFVIQAICAGSSKTLSSDRVGWLEKHIHTYESKCPPPEGFVIPGSTRQSALFDVARTKARRTERLSVRWNEKSHIVPQTILVYLNRLSSFLYACARYACTWEHVHEKNPAY
jgi:cob(I)alamin adenosyltransferase